MNNPKSIFTSSKFALKRRFSESANHPSSASSQSQDPISARPGLTRSPSDNSPVPYISYSRHPSRSDHLKTPPQSALRDPTSHSSPNSVPNHRQVAFSSYSSGLKRPLSPRSDSPVGGQSGDRENDRKKSRRRDKPTRHLHPHSFSGFPGSASQEPQSPTSPLFFSNTPHPRPELPPRFSSAEAAAKMLSKTKGEDSNVKTVTLARGSYAATSPSNQRPRLRSYVSHETATSSRTDSSDPSDKPEQFRLLSKIGVTELIEQDDRPGFILDLFDPIIPETGALNILFANSALRSYGSLLDILTARAEETESATLPSSSFAQFKEWLLNASINAESPLVGLPAFIFASTSWSSSILRKRFRVISGNLLTYSSSASSVAGRQPLLQGEHSATDQAFNSPNQDTSYTEAHDYFQNAVAPRSVPPPSPPTPSQQNQPSDLDSSRSPALSPLSKQEIDINKPSAETTTPFQTDSAWPEAHLFESPEFIAEVAPTAVPSKEVGFFDWTRLPLTADLPEHIRFARSVDWSSTALGPIENWSADLRQMCNLIMASPHPAAMYWGDDLVAIYNEAYVFLAGQKHPDLMGTSYRKAWAEIWDEVKDVFAGAQTTGQATMKDDDCLFIRRSNFLEETYFSWSIIPMVGGDGSVMGLYNPAFEKTRRKIAERRMLTLREVGERTAAARDVKGFWDEVLGALECNEYDTPFVLLYSIGDDDSSDESSVTSGSKASGPRYCYLEGSLGVPEGHPAAPDSVELKSGTEGFVSIFRDVAKTNKPALLDVNNGDVSASLLTGLDWRGFGDPSTSVVVCPIHPTTGDNILGFLVMGINPRRPYDDDYSLFVQLLSRQLATSLASVVLFEEEIKRGQRAAKLAALDRIELSEQLAARTQEAIESETKFSRMAEFAPVGMFIANSSGKMTFCNDTWYEISRVPKGLESSDRWLDYIDDNDRSLVAQAWEELVEEKKPVTAEWRFKAPSINKDGSQISTWVLFSGYPEKDENGALKSVFGSVTNISQQKWAEDIQKKKTEEAVELKRQRENFIDTTSHEMRNPLSAILQCAEEIVTSLSEARTKFTSEEDASVFDANIDAAQTIGLCAQHQKRIVDDVLTMSKLDSSMLVVTPVDVQPVTVVQRALKMFDGEFQSADIAMKFIVDDSFKSLNIDWVKFDPSRALQVLINLITNAIKFTTTEKKRTITLTLGASLERPSEKASNTVSYVPARSSDLDTEQGADWGNGEVVFIHFSVQDTGRGLSEEEKKSLFLRFKQASPRTHVQYGGSGLGLFISRELTELQGGEIGVASISGEGSTFAFFVRARRSSAPPDQLLMHNSLNLRRTSDGKTVTWKPHPRVVGNGQASPSSQASSIQEQDRLKILIVEDNLVNQRVLQKQLVRMGYEVHVANHGGEALERLRESRFAKQQEQNSEALDLHVILMDQEMPVMDGITCTKRIRDMEAAGELIKHVPIIAVTANARQEQVKDAMEAGMDDVVSKPFRIADLVPKIEELRVQAQPLPMNASSSSK